MNKGKTFQVEGLVEGSAETGLLGKALEGMCEILSSFKALVKSQCL